MSKKGANISLSSYDDILSLQKSGTRQKMEIFFLLRFQRKTGEKCGGSANMGMNGKQHLVIEPQIIPGARFVARDV